MNEHETNSFETDEPARRKDAGQAAPPGRPDAELTAQSLHWQAASRFLRTGDRQRLAADLQAIAAQFPHSVWALRTYLSGPTAQAG